MRYEFWRHVKSGEVWAVEIVEKHDVESGNYISEGPNRVCGPLTYRECAQYPDPSEYNFDDDAGEFFETEEFVVVEFVNALPDA